MKFQVPQGIVGPVHHRSLPYKEDGEQQKHWNIYQVCLPEYLPESIVDNSDHQEKKIGDEYQRADIDHDRKRQAGAVFINQIEHEAYYRNENTGK